MTGAFKAGQEDRPRLSPVSKLGLKSVETQSANTNLEPDICDPVHVAGLAAVAILEIFVERHEKLKSFVRGLP